MNFKKALGFTAAVVMISGIFVGCTKEATPDTTPETSVTKTETPQLNGYNLLWSDEFDGDTLNEENWNRELREPGWTNNELQEYTDSDDNIFVRDGKLVLKAIKTEKDGKHYITITKMDDRYIYAFDPYYKSVSEIKSAMGVEIVNDKPFLYNRKILIERFISEKPLEFTLGIEKYREAILFYRKDSIKEREFVV